VPIYSPPTPHRFFWIGYGISLFLGGFGSLTALALAAPANPLCNASRRIEVQSSSRT
jgi:hypothetical protein